MAVKASESITLFHNIDIISTTYYYKLITNLTVPNVPDNSVVDPTTSAGGSWSTSEPTYTEGSTSYLYYTIQTKFSNGTQSYSYANIVSGNRKACLSSSYEAAKSAYNKAQNITNRVDDKENHFNFKYYTDVIVYGEVNKFYPVMIKVGDQNVKRTIMIKRSYNERAPAEWNKSTHQGALTLKILTNFGGWGGTTYSWEISEFQEQYAHIFGGAELMPTSTGFCIFLRGGGTNGAIYHLYSDQSLTTPGPYDYGWDEELQKYKQHVLTSPQISYRTNYVQYKSDLCFGAPGNKTQNPAGSGYYDDLEYKYDAPAPRNMVDSGTTTEGGFTKYVRSSSQDEEIRVRNYVKLAQDTDKKVVKSTSTEYYSSDSSISLSGGSWVSSRPVLMDNKYLWYRQKIVYSDNTSIYTNAICIDSKTGVRNLLKGTGDATGDVASGGGDLVNVSGLFECTKGVKTNTAWNERYINLKNVYDRGGFKVGDTLTASVYVKADSAETKTFYLYRAHANTNSPDGAKNISLTTNWQKIYFTFVATDYSKTATTTRIECSTAMSSGNYLYWAGWKLEKGNIPSDWTPAPEDIDSKITDTNKVIISDSAPDSIDKIWFDTNSNKFKEWNSTTNSWEVIHTYSQEINQAVETLQASYDPTVELANTLNNLLSALNTTVLGQNVIVSETAPTTTADKAKYWLDPSDSTIKKWSEDDSAWVPVSPTSIMLTIHNFDSDIQSLKDKVVFDFVDQTDKQQFLDNWTSVKTLSDRFNQRFEFNSYGLTISSSESTTYKLRLTNQDIKILANDVSVSTWDASGFNCATITTESVILRRGNFNQGEVPYSFRFIYNTNGSVSFRKVVEE